MNEEDTKVAEIFEEDINKLCKDINAVIEAHNKLVDEKVVLENIIKEVREYVIQEMDTINAITYINILEILNKVD